MMACVNDLSRDEICVQAMVLFLQRLPTKGWTEKEVETVLSKAFMWRATFDDAQSHLTQR